ncbi:hypothetical protein LINPERHAP1_LOCUS29902 [Linum perenne]
MGPFTEAPYSLFQ